MSVLINTLIIFNFNTHSDIGNWRIVNDGVMGGVSSSNFEMNSDGHAVFSGHVSLENNGGFASVQGDIGQIKVKGYTKLKIRLKGDGKIYQLRIKSDKDEKHSYVSPFKTSGDWEEITLNLADLYPTFRGNKLDLPNFSSASFEQLSFLIGNKKEQDFKLLLDQIELIKE